MYTDVNKIACHKDATAGAKIAKIAAGGSMDIQWNTWPESHVGPIIDYMAKVDDATSAKAADLKFFKIAEEAYVNGEWAATKIIKNNLTWTVTIPSSIAPGQYVLRHEILALHSAGQADGAQNYPKCKFSPILCYTSGPNAFQVSTWRLLVPALRTLPV